MSNSENQKSVLPKKTVAVTKEDGSVVVTNNTQRLMYELYTEVSGLDEKGAFTFDEIRQAYLDVDRIEEAYSLVECTQQEGLVCIVMHLGDGEAKLIAMEDGNPMFDTEDGKLFYPEDEDEVTVTKLDDDWLNGMMQNPTLKEAFGKMVKRASEDQEDELEPQSKMEQLVAILLDDLPNERALRQEVEPFIEKAPLMMKLLGALTAFQERAYDLDSWKPAPF